MAKNGWDRPLSIEIQARLPDLASAMQAGYDASGMGIKSGRLRMHLGRIQNYKVRRSASKTKARIMLTIPLAYARILDEGGAIPDRRPVRAKYMAFFAYGRQWFLKFAKGYDVRARHYIRSGVDEFIQRYAIEGGVTVRWAK